MNITYLYKTLKQKHIPSTKDNILELAIDNKDLRQRSIVSCIIAPKVSITLIIAWLCFVLQTKITNS